MARLLLCQKATTRNHRCKPLHRALQLYGVSVVGIFCRRSRSISIPRTKAMEKSSQTEEQSQSHDSSTSSHDRQNWKTEQNILKEKLITEDNFTWKLPPSTSQELRYVGGCDISFSKHDPSLACGTLVVLDFHTLEVVYQDFSLVTLNVPYVAGFLAFRELLMVDGNGILHPRGFGLACHIGVTADLPTIGVGKNLHCVDGLNQSRVRKLLEAKENTSKDFVTLVGCSGRTWGVAMRSTQGSVKPIFISIGHRISLQTATAIVQMTCKYRVPEPIRQADIRSRDYIRKFEMNPKLRLLSE
ncbi:endonuclease V isoform X2 [Trifolium pratense]|uniref:endonuclease V isoform X2 n=1 Tax=Trifolium pratense TaxID=57577 RepID=UPI001E6947CF|nr:endonuclease V isoform X2 [Trifolium pratense]